MSKDLQGQIKQSVLLLRFRTQEPTKKSYKYLSYRVISQALKLTVNEVQYICTKALKKPKVLTLKKKSHLLEQEHIDFLLSP